MNWNAIGAIGQILGSLATFVTVGYLVVQVHDSERETRRAIAQTRAERTMQMNLTLATNERLTAIHLKANAGRPMRFITAQQDKLSPDEAFSLFVELLARWNNLAETIIHLEELLPEDRAQFDSSTRLLVSEPAFISWYEIAKPTLNPKAVSYVDNLLPRPGNASSSPPPSVDVPQ